MHQLECKKCGFSYSAPTTANDIYICPKCNSYVGCLCDYGFGPIVPCIIFHGEKEVAKIDYRNHTEYQLKSDAFGLDIALTKGYKNLEVYDEATIIITDALKEENPAALREYQPEIRKLAEYYESPLWKEDYEADEDGMLPKDP